ncbi:OLD family protein [Mycolicibacterium arenosum]|uniref:ATP-dependent endonuclease n=1 Tax=Mycolicibacterium arenosum TaxID=2952157 RepID=A0ABT1M642_9MYCO|nr:hypothetical protein [Mycolicibacterium sp. CAU 1645]MCP9274050.1 hypothetical protein [Mycolicibacterium sp. CAU 1645]
MAVKKDTDGFSHVADTAAGNENHAKAISGLFRDNVIPHLLDRYSTIPSSAGALLLVEGESDERFLELAMAGLGYDEKLRDLHVIHSTGVDSLVAQAVLLGVEASQPVWALFDSDENGRKGRDVLKRFNFENDDILEYGKFVSGSYTQDAEAEWLFASSLMQRFVDDLGEEIVLKSKAFKFKDWRYDFTPIGKEHFPLWLEKHAKAKDYAGWTPVLEALSNKLSTA